MHYRPEIDGLRSLAVVPVILFHAGFPLFSGGFVGVDVFFVISGYLITTILIEDLKAQRFSLLHFYERRCRRILPALILVTLVCIPVAWATLMPVEMKNFAQSVAAIGIFSSNFLFWKESGYFDQNAELKPMLHTWSLAVEEQFYILFPILLLTLYKFGQRIVLVAIFALLVISFLLAEWGSRQTPGAAFFLLHARAWELMLGSTAAFATMNGVQDKLPRPVLEGIGLLGLGMIFISVFFFDKSTPFPGVYALVPTVGAALILVFSGKTSLVRNILSWRLFVFIGLISFSAYLWHQPLFAFTRYRTVGAPSEITMALLVLVTFGLAWLSYAFVEQPFRRAGTANRRQVFLVSGVGLFLMLGLGGFGQLQNGFPQRMTQSQLNAIASVETSPLLEECTDSWSTHRRLAEACRYFVEEPSWVVFGDSYVPAIAYEVAKVLLPLQDGVQHMSYAGCVPRFRSSMDGNCTTWTNLAFEDIIASKETKNVIVVYRIAAQLFGDHAETYPDLPDDKTDLEREEIWRSYVGLVSELAASGRNVYLVIQPPDLRADISQIIRVELKSSQRGHVLGVPRDWWDARLSFVINRLGDIPKSVTVIEPTSLFCDESFCDAVRDGKALYVDDNHLSLSGARIIADEIFKQVH